MGVAEPTNTSRPSISGTAQVGHTLQGHDGSWDSVTPTEYSRSWCRVQGSSCVKVKSGSTYTLAPGDIGTRLRFVVKATNVAGSTTATSSPTSPVASDPPDNRAKPTFTGEARQGATLTKTSNGSWSDPEPVAYSSQWKRCDGAGGACSDIPGAVGDSYTLTAEDVGHSIRLHVSATHPYGVGEADSDPSAVVGAPASTPRKRKLRPRRISPFPKILLVGSLSANGALFREVTVKAPRGVTVRVRCRGRGCPYRRRSYRMRRRKLRLRSLEHNFAAGATIVFRVVKRERIGKYTRVRVRRGRVPARVDRCLNPGSSRPRRCRR
jgi:hypothetical protein